MKTDPGKRRRRKKSSLQTLSKLLDEPDIGQSGLSGSDSDKEDGEDI